MKLLNILVLSLLLLVAVAFSASYFLPAKVDIKLKVYLEEQPEEVYYYINNPTEWENWSVLSKKHDPSIIHLYGGPMEGKGTRLQWSGDKAGSGQLVFTESISPNLISYQQTNPEDLTVTVGSFTLEPDGGGTQVLWRQQTSLNETPLAKLQGVLRKYKMQQEMEEGLKGLSNLIPAKGKNKAT